MTKKKRPPQDYNLSERACPFCHKSVKVQRHMTALSTYDYRVKCVRMKCFVRPATFWCFSKEEAVRQWNGEKA